MNKLKHLLRLLVEGQSKRQISKLISLSRNTIDKYVSMLELHPLSYSELLHLSDKELYSIVLPPSEHKSSHEMLYSRFSSMESALKRVGVTKFSLWEAYKSEHADGVQYSQFCEHFNRYLKSQQLSYVFEHKAGDKLMIDFAGKKLHLTDAETGEMTAVEVFVGILPCSGFTYAQACMSQQSPDFLGCLGACLQFIGGVPAAIVTDNLKPAVNRASKYDPELNKSMAEFAEHYSTSILPTRARKPKDKALVESAVNILYTRVYAVLHGKVFHRLGDLNKAIVALVNKHNDMLFQKKDFSRRQQFDAVEKQALKALPAKAFQLRKYQKAKVHPNCHVLLSEDKHNYSVPYQYVGKKVEIGYSHEAVEIYYLYERIAIHERLRLAHKYTTNAAHLHPRHQYYHNWSQAYFTEQGLKIGEHTHRLMGQIFLQYKHPEQGFKICQGVLQLARRHGNQRIEQAAELCILYDFVSYRKLEYILSLDFEDSNLTEPQEKINLPHDNIRGDSYYQ